jgi:predicted RNase H-like nuclease
MFQYQSDNPNNAHNGARLQLGADLSEQRWRVGVDGCKAGWFYVASDGRLKKCGIVSSVSDVFTRFVDISEVIIDIPIGLYNADAEPRPCDVQSRRFIKPRGSTIFPAPLRPCLMPDDYILACSVSEQLSGKKVSKQAFNIFKRLCLY